MSHFIRTKTSVAQFLAMLTVSVFAQMAASSSDTIANDPNNRVPNADTLGPQTIAQQLDGYLLTTVNEMRENGFRIEHDIGNISPYINQNQCSDSLKISLRRNIMDSESNTFEVSCSTPAWQAFIPVRIGVFANLVAARQPIPKNTMIRREHLALKEYQVNKGRYASYTSIEQVVGMVAKRGIRNENLIKPSHLKAPTLISRGDEVVITAKNSSIAIQMKGEALSSGTLGQQIRVKNLSSSRIIKAQVIESGRVSVIM